MVWFRKNKKDEDAKKKPAKKSSSKKNIDELKATARPSKYISPTMPSQGKDVSPSPSEVLKKKSQQPKVKVEQPVSQPTQPQVHYQETPRELPDGYGDNHIYLMVRDPYWMYSYWEIQRDHQERMLRQLNASLNDVNSVLRVYDVTNQSQSSFFDIVLQGFVKNWYVNAEPNRSYFVEIGLRHRDGRYVAMARSNQITTPRAGMSEIIDERWMGIDFDKMYALSGGFEVGKSSLELKKLMEERLMGAISSGSGAGLISSMGSVVKKEKQRGFWFILDCELIVYGATEPDARVTLQGREIKLRPDGTFSLRFALPDGNYVLDAHAHSADGIEERIIIPVVNRKTDRPAPILKPTE